jgi:2-oxoglutarate ferredoxin oxidoreductase subunit beta
MKYVRERAIPHTHCAGCGNGIVAQCFLRAVDELGLDMRTMVFVSGIGCSGWIPSPFFMADTLHTTHGRPIAFASGVKLSRPELQVIVFTGDGDGVAIGGNHLIHAARRNIGLKVLLVNNMTYGMTGGEVGPTTPKGIITKTTPFGNLERPFDLSNLMIGAGATYVARWTTFHIAQLVASMKKTLRRRGFSFIEIVSQCPVRYGHRVGMEEPKKMMCWFRDSSITLEKARGMSEGELKGKFIVGEFVDFEAPELTEEYKKLFEAIVT